MKVTFWVYLVGAVALAGVPPLAGFWSKDEILAEGYQLNMLAFLMLTVAAFLTAFYMGRQVLMVFFGKPRSPAAEHAEESPPVMTVPLIILAVLSFFGGTLNLPQFHTFTDWLERTHWLEVPVEKMHEVLVLGSFIWWIAVLSSVLAIVAIVLAWLIYRPKRYEAFWSAPAAKRPDDPLRGIIGPLFEALKSKWWVDELYWAVIVNPYIALSKFLADVVDWRFWHDWFHDVVIVGNWNRLAHLLSIRIDLGGIDAFANGLGDAAKRAASSLRQAETGYVRHYALSIFLGVVLILGFLLLR
jgi:NADH-quinone oxidoreductase subunit L